MIQNIILRVLEAWALELLGISHIRMQKNAYRKQEVCIIFSYVKKNFLCINGEAYPENSFMPAGFMEFTIMRRGMECIM